MQGWFAWGYDFLPNHFILPVFVGTHFTKDTQHFIIDLLSRFPHFFGEIGCRDISTLEFCQTYKLTSYFTRCLTLTLDTRKQDKKYHKVFFVDIPTKLLRYFPSSLLDSAEYITHDIPDAYHEQAHKIAQNLLHRYKNEAKLVITTRLHCASPCVAMGIPVVLMSDNPKEQHTRFSALRGILPIYSIEDLKQGNIDFAPKSLNIEELKSAMLTNLKLSIAKACGDNIDENVLLKARSIIADFCVS